MGWNAKVNTKGENVKKTSSLIFALVLVLSLVLIMAGSMATPVQATDKDSGWYSGQDADNDNLSGTETWSNEDNALEQDGDEAVVLLWVGHNTSYYLKVTDFGFNIPATAEIRGIEVEVDRYYSTTGTATVVDNSIRLVQGDNITGADRSVGATWPNSETDNYESFGDSDDLWGLSWAPADINNSNFGVAIQAVLGVSGAANAWVDHIRITVYYSVDEYILTMAVDPTGVGNSATDITGESPYEAGEVVEIEAAAGTGYEFVEWTADPPTPGGFGDAEFPETTFTMPAYNVTVTANFEEPSGPTVPPTVTTVAASGITRYTATLHMDFTLGDYTSVAIRFAYRELGTLPWGYSTDWINRTGDGSYPDGISGLDPDTWYEFQAQLRYNVNDYKFGDKLEFKTDALGGSICFIATAAYGNPAAEQIDVLREFRDNVLLESTAGSLFVSLYYQLSPPVADFIAGNELLRTLVRELLIDPIVCVVEATGDIWRN